MGACVWRIPGSEYRAGDDDLGATGGADMKGDEKKNEINGICGYIHKGTDGAKIITAL